MSHRRDILALTLGLSLLLIGAKVVLLPFPVSTPGEFARWGLRLAIVVSPDICFAAGLAVGCLCLARIGRQFPAALAVLRTACWLLFYGAGLYAVASVPIYRWTMVPLTLPALWLAGGGEMSSSVFACVGWGTWLALLVAPLAVLMSPIVVHRLRWPQLSPPGAYLAISAVLIIAAYGLVCRTYVRSQWTDPNRWERRIAQSPHAVFLASCLAELFRGDTSEIFSDPDESDFATVYSPPYQRGAGGWDGFPIRPTGIAPPQNVILIVLESTGVEYLGLYGSRHDTTPHLERLARETGVVFDNTYVQTPSSCNSLAALVASVYPRPDWSLMVRDCPDFDVPTVAEVLAEQGYRTCFAHSGYWSWKGRDDFLRQRGGQMLIDAASLQDTSPTRQRGSSSSIEPVNSWGVSDRAMFQATLDWIDAEPSRPFFLLAYTIETHHPYVAREPLRDFGVKDQDLNRYLNSVRAADETIAWLMDELRRRGLDRSTLVAITADHGESFGQHNQRIHSFCIYEPAVHVPLVLLHPSLKDYQRRIETVCQHIDIVPTALSLLGIAAPHEWQGRNVLARDSAEAGQATGAAPRPAFFFSTGNEIVLGLREGNFKYHYYLSSGHEELFDIAADRQESCNLALDDVDRCAGYKRRLGGYVRYQRRFLAERGSR